MTLSEQRGLLAAWLREWRLEQELPPAEGAADAKPPETAADTAEAQAPDRTVRATEAGLAAGDIVLLPPEGSGPASRPVYVALLRKEAPGQWLCAPFSRFSTPATEGEYSTGRQYAPLKVVCAWNAGAITADVLCRGWLTGRLGAAELKTVSDFALRRRAELPPSRRGPPLVHPLDPRHDYIEEERTLWFDIGGNALRPAEEPFVLEVREAQSEYAADGDDGPPSGDGGPEGGSGSDTGRQQ